MSSTSSAGVLLTPGRAPAAEEEWILGVRRSRLKQSQEPWAIFEKDPEFARRWAIALMAGPAADRLFRAVRDLDRVARHECSHWIVGRHFGLSVGGLAIALEQVGNDVHIHGRCHVVDSDAVPEEAPTISELSRYGRDIARASLIVFGMGWAIGWAAVRKVLRELIAEADGLIIKNREQILLLSMDLLEQRAMTFQQVRHAMYGIEAYKAGFDFETVVRKAAA